MSAITPFGAWTKPARRRVHQQHMLDRLFAYVDGTEEKVDALGEEGEGDEAMRSVGVKVNGCLHIQNVDTYP